VLLAGAIVASGWYGARLLRRWSARAAAAAILSPDGQTAAGIAAMPVSANFALSDPDSSFVPSLGGSDSRVATRFKSALADVFTLNATAREKARADVPPRSLDIPAIAGTMTAGINPRVTIFRRGLSSISLPAWIVSQIGEDLNEVMAYPKIDLPMYKPLSDTAAERLLPNINRIENNSITLMETNLRFIEAYMVGLNHEFARELLWREYPTDQRGSYFRQFWAVDNYIDSEGLSRDALQEKLYDIPEIHRWLPGSALGAHNNRAEPEHPTAAQAVLIVRGELLKKYPNTVIFAQHAVMVNNLRTPDWLTDAEEAAPPRSKTRTPLFSANPVDDIFFFGFDLTIDEVRSSDSDPGWYFVLQERPGEARFGLEVSRAESTVHVFDELTWDDVAPAVAPGQSLPAGAFATVALTSPGSAPADADTLAQFNDDSKVNPSSASSARWAYVLFRQPVMVAVHADEMLAQNRP
jgi:hypothetical protein